MQETDAMQSFTLRSPELGNTKQPECWTKFNTREIYVEFIELLNSAMRRIRPQSSGMINSAIGLRLETALRGR